MKRWWHIHTIFRIPLSQKWLDSIHIYIDIEIPILDNIDYICNIVILTLSRSPKYWVILLWVFSDAFGTPHMDITSQRFSPWRCTRLVFSHLRMYIVHWDRYFMAITRTVVLCLTNGRTVPSVSDSLTDGLLVLLGNLSLTTRYFSEDCDTWTDGDSNPLTLPTILSLAFPRRVNRSSAFNHSLYNYGSSSWSIMTWIFDFIDTTSLIQTSISTYVLLTTVDNISSNTTWYFGEIEPANRFRTNPTCV